MSTAAITTTTNPPAGVISTPTDLILFVSLTGGIVLLFVILFFIFFIWDQQREHPFETNMKRRNKRCSRYLGSGINPNYDGWMMNSNVPAIPRPKVIGAAGSSSSDLAKRADDQAIGYINELFSDITDEHEMYERKNNEENAKKDAKNMGQYNYLNGQYRQISDNNLLRPPVRSSQESETGEISQGYYRGQPLPIGQHRSSKNSNFSHVEIGRRSVTPDYSKHDKTKQMVMLTNYVPAQKSPKNINNHHHNENNEDKLKSSSAKKYIVTTTDNVDVIRDSSSPSQIHNLQPSELFGYNKSRHYP